MKTDREMLTDTVHELRNAVLPPILAAQRRDAIPDGAVVALQRVLSSDTGRMSKADCDAPPPTPRAGDYIYAALPGETGPSPKVSVQAIREHHRPAVVDTLLGPMRRGACDLCSKPARCLWPHMQPPVRACEDHRTRLDPWRRREIAGLVNVLKARAAALEKRARFADFPSRAEVDRVMQYMLNAIAERRTQVRRSKLLGVLAQRAALKPGMWIRWDAVPDNALVRDHSDQRWHVARKLNGRGMWVGNDRGEWATWDGAWKGWLWERGDPSVQLQEIIALDIDDAEDDEHTADKLRALVEEYDRARAAS